MEVQLFAIFDRKVREYGNILAAPNKDVIMRDVQVGVVGSGSLMEKYPEDFELHHLGSFDRITGEIMPLDGRPDVIVQLRDLVGSLKS